MRRTQQQLRRGDRLIELLKQLQHQPLPVEKEIVSIFCGSNGYLDDFIDWKTQKGYMVIPAYLNEIGSSSSAIRSIIMGLYNIPSIEIQNFSSKIIVVGFMLDKKKLEILN